MSESKPLCLLGHVNIETASSSYSILRVAQSYEHNIDFILNFLNESLRSEFLSESEQYDDRFVFHIEQNIPVWKKGFYNDANHIFHISHYEEISLEQFNLIKKYS